jgi:fructokinase
MAGLYAGIEAGGTKFAVVIGSGPGDIRAEIRLPTTGPGPTLAAVAGFLDDWSRHGDGPVQAIGIACFGPLDLQPGSATWGHITDTPKPGWAGTDIAGYFRQRYRLPVGLDTDVNGAGLGEFRWGAGAGCGVFVYLTVGTGIGGALVIDGKPVHGLVHPEMGHVRTPHDLARDPFPGNCPVHGDCLQGLASGRALQERWGVPAAELPREHPGWDLEADYLAQFCANLVLVCSPERIILGGGVLEQAHLLPRVRASLRRQLQGYVRSPRLESGMEGYLVPPALGQRAGTLGALCLAERALAG